MNNVHLEKQFETVIVACLIAQGWVGTLNEHRSALITNAVTGKINVEGLVI